jgi:hydrogenase maturation protein HypF
MDILQTIIPLPRALPPVLGAGAFLKNTLCLIQDDRALITRDNGSLDSIAAIEGYERTAAELLAQAEIKPIAVAHDLHPDFASTHFALKSGLKPFAIQHHHAHIAAIMAEHGTTTPVLGLALDGFGLGLNNESWGGELLRVDATGFQRLGHLALLPQPGGDIAARQTWRMGAAALRSLGRDDEITTRYAAFPNASTLATMMERGINCPPTSSAGRLFDAACGLLGVKPMAAFEGEAPMALEAMVREPKVDETGWTITESETTSILDMRPLLERLTELPPQPGAELFHGTFIAALADWAQKAAEQTGIRTVACGGGCFLNKVLREGLEQRMMAANLLPLFPKNLSPGDAAISCGQAFAAALAI